SARGLRAFSFGTSIGCSVFAAGREALPFQFLVVLADAGEAFAAQHEFAAPPPQRVAIPLLDAPMRDCGGRGPRRADRTIRRRGGRALEDGQVAMHVSS